MAISVFPDIAPEDYDAFRAICGSDIPNSHDGMTDLISQQSTQLLKAEGMTVKHTKIKPDEFARDCDTHGTARSFRGLCAYAFRKTFGPQ